MIAYFPSLYPDELLYSWFARYHEHSGNMSPKRTMHELFGHTSISAVIDLPSNLRAFLQNIKQFSPPNLKELIEQHTLYKYYTFFQPDKLKKKALDYIENSGMSGSIHTTLGIATFTIKEWQYIRFCPSCVKQDKANYGESYWHVSHQLPKVHYCHIHREPLLDSNIELRNPHKHEFFSADRAELGSTFPPNLYSRKTEQHLQKLSQECDKLMKIKVEIDRKKIEQVYKYLMQVNGYANYFGKVHQQYFTQQFKLYYGEEFLKLVSCNFDNELDSSWLRAIVRKHRKAFHTVQHILLLNFLGISIVDIPNLIGKESLPFGKAPYYCLNPAAPHYKEKVVTEIRITSCTETRKPVGTFICNCGFIYSRRGPDLIDTDFFKIGRVKKYGKVWHATLQSLLEEEYTYYQITQKLQCDYATVKKYANFRNQLADSSTQDDEEPKIQKQKEWKQLMLEYPYYKLTQLRRLNPALYTWHNRNNYEWLKKISPRAELGGNTNSRVDWEQRDLTTLLEVKHVIKKLYAIEKPISVCRSRVGKEIGKISWIEKLLYKLPKTKDYLEEHLETIEQYQIRRLKWACKQIYKSDEEEIVHWKIYKLAGLKCNNTHPEIQKIVEDELKKLSKKMMEN